MTYWRNQEDLPTHLEPGIEYNGRQLEAIADHMLREDSKGELCRECNGRGTETGNVAQISAQIDQEDVTNDQGEGLAVGFPEFTCEQGHRWFAGEGAARGIGGDNPILFEEHFQSRRRREIYTSIGTPDPEIVSGLYNRSHPQGRKINSLEQRQKNGASYYR